MWEILGGGVLSGETKEEAIIREAYEETRVKLDEENLKIVKEFNIKQVFQVIYLVWQDIDIENIVLQKEEVIDIKWAKYKEIEKLVKSNEFVLWLWKHIKDILKENM